MSSYVFYKSFLNHWMAFGVKGNDGEVWYSYDEIVFCPLEVVIEKERVYLEYPHGPVTWRGSVSRLNLEKGGDSLELNLANSDGNKPIFRLQKAITHSVVFDPDPKFRVVSGLYRLVDGRILCVTANNGHHYTKDTLKVYLLDKVGTGYVRCKIIDFSSNNSVINTDQGTLDFLAGTWEGYKMTTVNIEDYGFAENETEFVLYKK